MDLDEARAWLRGDRSTTNQMMSVESGDRVQTLAMIEVADAGMMWQALAVVMYAATHRDAASTGPR